ncbi:MAG: flagellar biosynthesis protein [Rubrivivax sp.]|nr:flagellar biosynthesis protein [Rubrivivax sp.]
MNSSSSFARRVLQNVPSPNPERTSYARFIPREELGAVEAWSLDGFGAVPRRASAAAAAPAPAAPPEPTADEWRQRIDAARQAGYQDGYRDGMAGLEGFKKTHAEQMGAQVSRFLLGLDHEFDVLHAQLAETVARVAVQLARQVVRTELRTDPGCVAAVAAEAVEAVLQTARHITLQVNPQDLPLVAAAAEETLRARGARVLANPGIARGGCRVDSDMGSIDAGIAQRWAQAAASLGSDEPWDEAVPPAPEDHDAQP